MQSDPIHVSIIVPTYNNPKDLVECVSALQAAHPPHSEIIVVNDGSTDETRSIAEGLGVTVLHLSENTGGAAARNYGVRNARGDIFFFIDSDVVVGPDTVDDVVQFFHERPEFSAIFGSYDAEPRAKSFVSQYRNLLHHFFHQCGKSEASTFWAGCGAIRRTAFEMVGGFNDDFKTNLEDVELGYRLKRAGCRIRLDKTLQVTHLKRWTFFSMIRADVISRAVPWSRLILEAREFPHDLNVDVTQRLSLTLAMLGVIFLFAGMVWSPLLWVSVAVLSGTIILNKSLFAFFFRQRGLMFTCGCIPLYWLYYLYSGMAFLIVLFDYTVLRRVKFHT